MALPEEREQEWHEEAMDERPCRHCRGKGYLTTELDGGGPAHHCPDCDGTGTEL